MTELTVFDLLACLRRCIQRSRYCHTSFAVNRYRAGGITDNFANIVPTALDGSGH